VGLAVTEIALTLDHGIAPLVGDPLHHGAQQAFELSLRLNWLQSGEHYGELMPARQWPRTALG
jgi:hypothetical protein